MKKLNIAIDFDGTIVSEKHPKIGVLINGAKKTINKWYKEGHIIIINTCRHELYQARAERFLKRYNVKFHHINSNNPRLVEKYGSDCRKISADVYIDNLNALSRSSRVDWGRLDDHITKLSMEKPLIIAIVGGSGAGKTTVAEFIEKEYGIFMITSHTDRPRRYPKETGHTFHAPERFNKFKRENMIAFTDFGNKRYCCLKSDVRLENTYVINESGLAMLSKDDYDVFSIRVFSSKRKLLERGVVEGRIKRDKGQFSFYRPWMKWFSKFDYCINNSGSIESTKDKVRVIVHDILMSRA